MRKTLALALVASAAVLGFKAYADNHGQTVGNADSNNMLVIEEEGYNLVKNFFNWDSYVKQVIQEFYE